MSNEIGEQGNDLNLSHASRAMNMPPDEDQVKLYDEYPNGNPIKYILLLLLLGMLGLTIYLFQGGHWILGILGVVGTLFLALLNFVFGSATKKMAYENGLIIPAIVVNTNPIELLAMADMRSSEEQEPILGVLKMSVKSLPNHKIELDEKIPCVSLFGMAKKGYRRDFEPRPICWGFKDASLIPRIVEVISQEETNNELYTTEWEMLYKLKSKINVDIEYNKVVFFDVNLTEANI